MTAHPDREELIFFGGEYFNGAKVSVFTHCTLADEWKSLKH